MNGQTIAAEIVAGVLVLGMIGSIIVLAFRLGVLSGRIESFMRTADRDRTETNQILVRIEGKVDGYLMTSHSSKP